MSQTKTLSFIEAMLNTFLGYFINLAAQPLIYGLFGVTFTFSQNVLIGLCFMFISLIRSYGIRRWCNKYLHEFAVYLAVRLSGVKI